MYNVSNLKNKLSGAAVAGSITLALAFAPAANASLIIEVSSGGDLFQVTDNAIGDVSGSTDGVVTFVGAVGSFTTSIAVGSSKPAIGSEFSPYLDLNAVEINGNGIGTVIVRVTDTDFRGPVTEASFLSSVGGTTLGTVEINTYIDNSNAEFGMGTLLNGTGALMSMNGDAFSHSRLANFTPTDPFSLTIEAIITHTAPSNISSFDASVRVPEPTTLGLVGVGLMLLAVRRNKRAA